MGILKHLLFWPVTGPLYLIDFSLGKVEGVVREELTDDTSVKAELLELQLALELGDITDDEYSQREAALMQRLREVREWREQFGMGVSGGPVRVAESAKAESPAAEAAETEPVEEAEGRTPQVARPDDVTIEFNLDDWH
jgi:hypothetical protein